jgi:hypothetical protein
MVHYLVPQRAERTAPATCPKCGSHRTEAAGRSESGRGIDVRCHDCDKRFSMLIDRRTSDAANLTDEIEAIRVVGRAFAQLPDAASRARVLRWAAERFQIDTAVTPAAAPAAAPAAPVKAAKVNGPDLTLSMDGLHDLFPAPKNQAHAQALESDLLTLEAKPVAELAPQVEETTPVDSAESGSVLHNFVNDFQRLANDCQTLFAS